MTDAIELLHLAADIMQERGKDYDQPNGERSMARTVAAFNTITGRDITETEGWAFMLLLKLVRQHQAQAWHKDSGRDAIAYAALMAEAGEAE